jgi:Predicted sugar phosphatases of the HAD superfamily
MNTYEINSDKKEIIINTECFLLDMDGTLNLDEHWISGAPEFLLAVRASGRRLCFLTNNSSKSGEAYLAKLHRMGFDADPATELVTSGEATINYLNTHHAGKRVFLLGNDLLKGEFSSSGIVLDNDSPDIVVTAFDTTLDYEKMCAVCDFVRAGLPFIATHPDKNCPTKTGFIPDIGAINAFIEASAGRVPDIIVGKPNDIIIDYALRKAGCPREKAAIVGDRLYTDIASAKNGLSSILVLSGETSLGDLENSDIVPSLIFGSVADITPLL